MTKEQLSAAADLLRIDADDPDDVFHDSYALAARILSLLASGEWQMVPRKMPPAMYAGGNISDLDWAALIAAAPDPLAEPQPDAQKYGDDLWEGCKPCQPV